MCLLVPLIQGVRRKKRMDLKIIFLEQLKDCQDDFIQIKGWCVLEGLHVKVCYETFQVKE